MHAFFNPIMVAAFLAVSASAASVTSTYTLLGPKCYPKDAPGPKNCKQTSNPKWGGYCVCTTLVDAPTPSAVSSSVTPIITPPPYVPQCNVPGQFYPSAAAPVHDLLYRVSLETCLSTCKGVDQCLSAFYDGVTGTGRCWLMTGNVEAVNYYPGPGGYVFYDKACELA